MPRGPGAGGSAHFWTLRPLDRLEGWDPDADPARFADAFGHVLLELFVRLRRRGRPVTIGPDVPGGAAVVVTLLEELVSYDGEPSSGAIRRLARAARHGPPVVVVRADVPLRVSAPRFASEVVMPNRAAVVDHRSQCWLPLLPQRGIVPRDPDRGDRVETVAYKGYPFNEPSWLRSREFLAELDAIGLRLELDTEAGRWPDFRQVDVVVCLRRHHDAWDDERHLRKPATKLVNAWVAGAIPVVGPQAGYLELVRPGEDALVATGPGGLVDALRTLVDDPALVRRLRSGIVPRAAEFSTERVLDRWEAWLAGGHHPPSSGLTTIALLHHTMRAGARRMRAGLRS